MEINLKLKVKPFTVPNYIISDDRAVKIKDGHGGAEFIESPKLRLSQLSAEDLELMCDQFTNSVFEKAKKKRIYPIVPAK